MNNDTIGSHPTAETLLRRAIEIGAISDPKRLEQAGLTGKLTTEQVAGWFTSRCNGGLEADEYPEWPNTWAPAAGESFAVVTIGGDLGDAKAITRDGEWPSNDYYWFDLAEVPKRGAVWRISCRRTLWLFYKSPDEEDRWTAYAVPNFG